MRYMAIIFAACWFLLTGCASYRNTALDHRIPDFVSPELKLAGLKSVQSRKEQDPELAFAMAMSGGGHRAANLAAGVLIGLESVAVPGKQRNALEEVDYFSTVSGGGFAAGSYIAARFDHESANTTDRFSFVEALQEDKGRRLKDLRRDYQGSMLTQWIHWKCLGFRDGGDLLQSKLDRNVLGSRHRTDKRSLKLGDVFKPAGSQEEVTLPYWITNATVYENGARFMFTPEFIAGYGIDRYVHNMKYCELEGDPLSLPLASGMRASASFPVVFPAATFKCLPREDKLNPYLHLLDGGLTDNLGVLSALELLEQDPAKRKLLVVVDAYTRSGHPYSAHRATPSGAGVAFRIMRIGLDSKHSSLARDTSEAAGAAEVHAVILGFDQLRPAIDETISDVKSELSAMRSRRLRAANRRMRRELELALAGKEKELESAEKAAEWMYQDASAVATSLSITKGEQSVLLRAGRALVERNRDELLRVLSRTEAAENAE